MPAVSVLMPAYNVAPYLDDAVESVLAQTYSDLELLIVDDGSQDETLAVAERHATGSRGRVRVFSQPNGGLASARNHAIAHATGEFLALLDSDDLWDPNFLSEQMAIFDARPGVAIVTGNARYLGGPRNGLPARPVPDPRPAINLLELIKDERAVYIMSVFRRRVVDRIGVFDEALRTNEDYDFWLRAALAGFRFARNPVPLGWQRRRDDSLSADDLRMILGILAVYRKHRPALDPGSPARAALEAQVGRFEAEALASQARRALAAGQYDASRQHLRAVLARRPTMRLRAAAALVGAMPAAAAHAWRLQARARLALASMPWPRSNAGAVVIRQGRPVLIERPPSRLRRVVTRLGHAIDHAIGRATGPRRVLIEARTPVHLAVLRPVYERLLADPRVEVSFISEDHPDMPRALREAGVSKRVVPRARTRWQRVDLYINADPWNSMTLRRCAARLNFFHGVAGKYNLDCPVNLPLGFNGYDRVAFVNADRLARYLAAGIVSHDQAALVGYPKIDSLVSGKIDGAEVRARLGLDPGRATILYAPTYSPASSLHVAGEAIVEALLAEGYNVIAKLHDRSFDPADNYSAGVDWRERLGRLAAPGRFVLGESGDSSPYLIASDLMVTDHSSIGFEFCVLDRPLVVYDAPDLVRVARINPEKVAELRRAADVVRDVAELPAAVRRALAEPGAHSAERRALAARMFYRPGTATDRAAVLAYELLALTPPGAAAPARAQGTRQPEVA